MTQFELDSGQQKKYLAQTNALAAIQEASTSTALAGRSITALNHVKGHQEARIEGMRSATEHLVSIGNTARKQSDATPGHWQAPCLEEIMTRRIWEAEFKIWNARKAIFEWVGNGTGLYKDIKRTHDKFCGVFSISVPASFILQDSSMLSEVGPTEGVPNKEDNIEGNVNGENGGLP